MKYIVRLFFLSVFLSACGSAGGASSLALSSPRAVQVISVTTVTPTLQGTPTPNQVQTAQAILAFDAATSAASSAATGTAYMVTSTHEARETQAFWVNVTLGVATEHGNQTKVAGTQIAGTQQADWKTQQPPSQTALAATQTVERNELKSKVASTWIWRVGGSFGLVGLLWLLILSGFDARRYLNEKGHAKNLQQKTSALKPDNQGRFPIIPSASLQKNETLLNPNLMYRAQLDPSAHDGLTADQALKHASGVHKLEAVRSISNSSAVGTLLKKMAKDDAIIATKQMPVGGVTITKPDQPLLPNAWPELPLPHWKMLNQWDGNLLPFGMDDKAQLMRVDTSTRPHFMVVGRSRSGKTLSSIRPMVACLLTMGWNVIVMGKRVDFMPFEDHPNFKLLAVDVRKDAQKYIDILNTMTAQMDIRDQILYNAKVSTWDRYGAPPTMIVIDDYSGAIERMPAKRALEVVSEVKSIAMDGAKFGLNLMLGLQKPTWENIDTTIRSQMGRIVYSVDIGDSRIALGEEGAERLPPQWNFLTRMTDNSSVQRGVGFVLQDAEIEAFLKSRPVPQNDQPNWIDATVVGDGAVVPAAVESVPVISGADDSRETADKFKQIQDLYREYLENQQKPNFAQIQRTVFGKTGGSFYENVIKAIADFEACQASEVNAIIEGRMASWSNTTASITPEMGNFPSNVG